MAENKRGLGRGLSALLGEGEAAMAEASQSPPETARRSAPIELIRRNPDQPRRVFDEGEIDELAASIREKGLLQPILVRPVDGAPGEFQIVAGERRWRAAQRAGLREVPIVVRQFDDAEALEIAILENVQRSDLNAVEEALGYKNLVSNFGRTQEEVASAIGKSRSHVANTLRLLALPQEVQEMVLAGQLSAGHARALIGSDDALALARRVVAGELNVRETEALVRNEGKTAAPRPQKPVDVDSRALERRVSETLGLAVEIKDRNGKGAISVRYESLEQLEDVCRKLGVEA